MTPDNYPFCTEDCSLGCRDHFQTDLEKNFMSSTISKSIIKRKEEMLRTQEETEDPAHQILHLPMAPNDADASTVGEYLGLLLSTLWIENENFSGKRPFGNSDWNFDLYDAMEKAGLCDISFDELLLRAIRLAYDHGE